MSPFFYAINIGTLATWLTVAGFGIVGTVIPEIWQGPAPANKLIPYQDLKPIVMTEGFTDAPLPPVPETDAAASSKAVQTADPVPTPPEMAEIPDLAALPEIPNLPAAVAKPAAIPTPTAAPPAAKPRPSQPSPSQPSPARPAAATGKATTGKPATGGQNTGSGLSDAKRLAGGRMPAPAYPAAARSRGQTGTVVVEFVVGPDGRVVSAYAKSPCSWPILNDCAVNTVRRWKFPLGAVTKYTRPITFKLK